MTTEQINEARNRPWADAEAIASESEDSPSIVGGGHHPKPPSKYGQPRWPWWPVVLLGAWAAIAVLVLMWGSRSGQLEVTVERKRAAC